MHNILIIYRFDPWIQKNRQLNIENKIMICKILYFQLFISLLSEKTIESKYCKDELALAYVSNKPIFPLGLAEPKELFPKMDTGMYVHW